MTDTITNVHVDCVNHDRTRAAAGFNCGEFRYHIWFNPKIGKGSAGDTLHKNPIDENSKIRHQSLNPKAAANAAMLAEMWRQIDEGRLIAKAVADEAMNELQEDAERDNDMYNKHVEQAAHAMRAALKTALEYFQDQNGGNPEYTEAAIRSALALAQPPVNG